MPKYQITSPDGQSYEVNAPEGASEEEAIQYVQANMYDPKPAKKSGKTYEFSAPSLDNLKTNAATFGRGLIGGAADIGDTLINAGVEGGEFIRNQVTTPSMSELIVGRQPSAVKKWNDERTNTLNSIQQEEMQDPLYMVGRIGGNIAGTAGVGGAAGNVLKAGSKTPQALRLAEALRTGGLTGYNTAYKVAGGVGSGAIGAALIDPESTATGAAIGGAIPAIGAAAPAIGGAAADIIGGIGTNTGGAPIRAAANAGMKGGQNQQALLSNMRGASELNDVIQTAEQGLNKLGQEASTAYRSGMVNIKNDKAILNFGGIDKSLDDAFGKVTYKGQPTNEAGAKVFQAINNEISKWKSLDPAEFHTPEGLDALKRKIGGIVDSIPLEEKTAKMVGNSVYNSIKGEINSQAPTYAKVMKDYSDGLSEINEVKKTLSLGGKATQDTKLRKLQSVMRNNVNTNYGERQRLVNMIDQSGNLNSALAGQALNDLTPRGLGKVVAGGAGLAALSNPAFIPGLLATSPRLVGETAVKVGQGANYAKKGAKALVPTVPALAGLLNY